LFKGGDLKKVKNKILNRLIMTDYGATLDLGTAERITAPSITMKLLQSILLYHYFYDKNRAEKT